MTQGKIERWHLSLKSRILLEKPAGVGGGETELDTQPSGQFGHHLHIFGLRPSSGGAGSHIS